MLATVMRALGLLTLLSLGFPETPSTLASEAPRLAIGLPSFGVPLILLLSLDPSTPDASESTESFELIQENAAKSPRVGQVPDGAFTQSTSDRERAERIARDALPKKQDLTPAEQLLMGIVVAAGEALDAKH